MKHNTYRHIKESKAFRPLDVLIYIVILLLILSLFLLLVILPKNADTNGFIITKNNDTVLVYNHNDKNISVSDRYKNLVKLDSLGNYFVITIHSTEDITHYNKISIDTSTLSAKMIESTCSSSKECVHMPAINNNGFIYCAIYGIKIVPINLGEISPPVVG